MPRPTLASLLEDFRNWNKTQDWMLNKQRDIYGNEDPDTIALNEKLAGIGTADMGMMGSSVGGLAAMLRASHGSPHLFNKFDFSKIGTGEGAQAYGHGGYFAQGFDSPVAKEYQDKLSTKVYMGGKRLDSIPSDSPQAQAHHSVVTAMSGQKIEPQEAINNAIKYWNDAADEMLAFEKTNPELRDRIIQEANSRRAIAKEAERLKPEDFYRDPGHLYNVELKWPDPAREAADPLGEHHLLDWFEPLSKQSEHVKKALRDYATLSGKEHYLSPESNLPVYTGEGISPDTRAKEYYEWLASQPLDTRGLASRELASSALKAFDVPGIKYWDEGSRSARQGTRNYVMFDDALANIVSRNGVSLSDLLQNPQQLTSLNPTGSVFAGYNPTARASLPLGENLTTLSETMGVSPDELITIYRGVPHDVSTINPGDFITTNQQLAKDYAGKGKVISQKVKASDILDDLNESLGEEYIYRPGLKKLLKK